MRNGNKKTFFAEANVMNTSAKFEPSSSVAMATNQIQRFGEE